MERKIVLDSYSACHGLVNKPKRCEKTRLQEARSLFKDKALFSLNLLIFHYEQYNVVYTHTHVVIF